jgi:hypothetical protein
MYSEAFTMSEGFTSLLTRSQRVFATNSQFPRSDFVAGKP